MPIRVLLAEDNTIVRHGLISLLKMADGITVVGEAEDGRKAFEEVLRLQPDVVIMDVAMPELNGIDAAQKICHACPPTRVVMLSVFASFDHVSLALKAGARGYLIKGVSAAEMIEAVKTVHAGNYYLARSIQGAMVEHLMEESDRPAEKGGNPFASLTWREREIMQMVVEGKSSSQIAETLGLALTSVYIYKSRMMKKVGVPDIATCVKLAIQYGLTTIPE